MQTETQATYPLDQDTQKPDNTPTGEKLSKYLVNLSENIESADRDKRLNLFRKQLRSHQYYDGNFYGYVDENCEWQTRKQTSNETWYSDNQYYPYIRTALMELNRRQTEVQIGPAYKSEELDNIAKFAQSRYNDNRDKTFNAHLKQTENTYAVLNGITFRYTYTEFNKSGRREKMPRMHKNAGEAKEDTYLCAGCSSPASPVNMDGNQSETPCDECGSTMVQIVSPDNEEIVIGYDEIPTAENKWVSPNPIGIIISMQASTLEESPFLKWKQLILRSVLEDKFPKFKLPSTATSTELRYIGNQQTTTPADSSGDMYSDGSKDVAANELELLEFQQHWLDYPVYAKKTFDEPQVLAHGKTLEAGKPLGSLFPNGLYYARIGDIIVDMWNEDKNDKWVSSPYSLRAGSCYGAGTFAAHADQEILNDFTALKMSNAWNNGVPREFVNPDYITELSADPSQVTEFKTIDGGGGLMGNGYMQASPTTLSPEIYGIEETAKGSMQNKIGALSGGAQGLADAQKWGDTATAIQIKRDLAVGRFAPDLELMADNLDRKQAYQFLANEQKFFTPSQWDRVKGDYDSEAMQGFVKCDIRRDLVITIVPGSYMPQSPSQTVANLNNYAQLAPVLMPLNKPDLMEFAGQTLGIPKDLAGWSMEKESTAKLLERFEALSKRFIEEHGDAPDSDLTNPNILGVATEINRYADMPVDTFLDNHPAIIDSLRDWRTTDKGQSASHIMLAAVGLRLQMHRKAIVAQGQMDTKDALEIQQPMQEQQQQEQLKQLAAQGMQEQDQGSVQATENENAEDMQILQGLSEKDEAQKDRDKEIEVAKINAANQNK